MSTAAFPEHVSSYYAATSQAPAPMPPLQGSVSADICVVGAGISGCSTALRLAERGYRVILLEGERLGWGASGRNGGQVIFGTAVAQPDLRQLLGVAEARQIWEVSLAGLELLKRNIERYRIDCDWVPGQMFAAIKSRQWRQLQAQQTDLARHYSYDSTRLIDRTELCSILATQRYLGALYDSNGGHLHPLRYTLGLARAAIDAGVQIHEASRAVNFSQNAGKITVRTAAGVV